jgi:hypothetical protein
MKSRANKIGKVERRVSPKRNLAILVVVVSIAGSVVAEVISQKSSKPTTALSQCASQAENPDLKTPHSLAELLALSPAELEHCDIARMNLLCAEGLPGSENLNVDEDLAWLDQWAEDLKWQIDRNFHHYLEDPAYYYNSTNFYKMVMMASILYSQFNIRYNPKLIEPPAETRLTDDEFFADSRDALIHGLLGSERMGTCSSMPVLYVALGRRLGYPLKLVSAKAHFFIRWDSPAERFNMDGTSKGMNKYDDERYKKWPFPISNDDIKADGLLQSLTPAQELSVFLSTRSACLHAAGRMRDAIAAHAAALRLEPNWRSNQWALQSAEREYAGISAVELEDAQPQSQDPQEILKFAMWKDETLNRLRSAELGTPDVQVSIHEAGLPAFSRNPIP